MNETTRYLFQIDNSLAIANKLVDLLNADINNTEITNKSYLLVNNISDTIIKTAIEKAISELENNNVSKEVKTYTTTYKLTSNSNVLGFLTSTLGSLNHTVNIINIEHDLDKNTLTAKYTITKQNPVVRAALTSLKNAMPIVEEENYKCKSKVFLSFT